jgi:tetratricopeptide (TPR) repeat protein
MDQLTEAVDSYRRAIAAGETDAWLNMGICLEDLGDLAGAMHAYRQADAAGDPHAAMALAYLLRDQGEHAEAESIARQGGGLGNLEAVGAAACWEYCRTLDPGLEADVRRGAAYYPSARADLADILRYTGRSEEALRELTLGAKLGEEVCWLPLGNRLRDDFSDTAAAEEAYRAGIVAGDSYCHHNLAVLLEERGDVRAAAEQFRQGAAAGDSLAENALRNPSTDPS